MVRQCKASSKSHVEIQHALDKDGKGRKVIFETHKILFMRICNIDIYIYIHRHGISSGFEALSEIDNSRTWYLARTCKSWSWEFVETPIDV